MFKQLIVSSILLTTIMTIQPDKPSPARFAIIMGSTKFDSVYNEQTGLWDVTWNAKSPYYFSVSITRALFSIRL